MMKNRYQYILLVMVSSFFFACEKNIEPYSEPQNRLGFEYERDVYGSVTDSVKRYTFLYDAPIPENNEHTIYIEVLTVGFVTDYDRKISIEQVPPRKGELQAVSGVHFVPLDDPRIESKLFVPAGSNKALLPIILKRDPSLSKTKYYLNLSIAENENFGLSYVKDRELLIEISDIPTCPKYWNDGAVYYFLGTYGAEKHKFLINVMGITFNDDYLFPIMGDPNSVDMGYTAFLANMYNAKLKEYNAERQAQGLDVLREASTVEGVKGELVYFVLNGTPLN